MDLCKIIKCSEEHKNNEIFVKYIYCISLGMAIVFILSSATARNRDTVKEI